MNVLLPDGSTLTLDAGATGRDAAVAIGPGLAKAALAVKTEKGLRDLSSPLVDGERMEIVTSKSEDALELIRHDCAHVLAAAVTELWPGTKVSIGPAIEDGFYYDFDFPPGVKVSDADFDAIEKRMREHIGAAESFARTEIPAQDALRRFAGAGETFKAELVQDLIDRGESTVSLYTNGSFVDLCRGPHSPSTASVGALKLMSVAGAYWRGDERNKMLTRIYGTAFPNRRSLDAHLERLEQAKARDHRKLGPRLGLFLLTEDAPGMPFYLPNGMVVMRLLESEIRAQLDKRGYVEIKTPQILDVDLWRRSGHYENYRESMYFTTNADPQELRRTVADGTFDSLRWFAVKPMNCPGACLVFGSEPRSYRELPLRLAEFGAVSRREREGVLHGLMRVQQFVQDDAHVYCAPEQIRAEVRDMCEAIGELYAAFGFADVRLELSTRPEKAIGSIEQWNRAESALEEALAELGASFELNPGDGAFYGPKIDFHITDALGRSWQCGTVQLDFFLPERFDLKYVGRDNAHHAPVLIHRALLGSMERFIGVLIEHYGGDFPLWLAPVQAVILPVADRHCAYAREVRDSLRAASLRAEVDDRSESLGRKIRDAEMSRAPYLIIVGDREEAARTVAVRSRSEGDEGSTGISSLVDRLTREKAEHR